ncbi:cyclic nucleotide-binding domain-containing protein [Myxococcota bacterium]|nr:cyclic nucleotide-binding domain-containing protein [Myxococcota bacterium]
MSGPALERLPLFKGLGDEALQALRGVVRQRTCKAGEVLFTEGDRAREMFILLAGNVSIFKRLPDAREECLATLVPGALVGELALIDGQPRSASARISGGEASLLVLARDDFDRLFRANKPFAFLVLDRIVVELSGRLRRATARLGEAAAENTPAARAQQARDAAMSLLGVDLTQFDLGEIDLDAIEVEIAPLEQRMRGRRG